MISVFFALLLILSLPTPCLVQSSAKDRVDFLYQKCSQLKNQGHYQEAIKYAEELVLEGEKAFGKDHPNVATFINNLALCYLSIGDYSKAETLYKRSLAIKEKAFGKNHLTVSFGLNGLAELYRITGDYSNAETLYKRSLAIRESALGPNHPDVATILNNMALLHESLGEYAKAETLFKRSLTIREKTLGPDHPLFASTLGNLSGVYRNIGNYTKAITLLKKSLEIKEKILGPNHPDVAISLNNLGWLYEYLGEFAKAESLYRRSQTIWEKTLGREHPRIAASLNNLAWFNKSIGDYTKAELMYKKSLAIREKTLGREHPDVAESLNNLASLYLTLGDYSKAESLHKRALAIWEKAFGPEHPLVATGLNNLATLYNSLGDYSRAEFMYKKSLSIREKTLGPEHPAVAQSLSSLALLYASLDNFEKAHNIYKKTHEIDSKLIDQAMGFTSEEQKIKFLSTKKWVLNCFLSLVEQHIILNHYARKDALDIWLKRKGVILEAQKRFQEALVYSDDPQTVKIFQELSRVRARVSKLTFSGPGKEGLEAYKKKIVDLEDQKNRLEGNLSQLSNTFALKQKIAKADSEKVAKALPENTVLIEFAKVGMRNFKAKGREKRWDPPHYLAFVLRAGKGDMVGLIDLGDASKIDKAVARFKGNITRMRGEEGTDTIDSSKKVHDLVFAPLKRELGDVKEIFISPDGNLNLIPFEVLQGPDGRYLIEDYTFNYLAAGRDVLGFGQIKEQGKRALLMGDPDFNMGAEERDSTLRKLDLTKLKDKVIAKRSSDMRGFHFTRLPGTREEVKAIQAIFGKEKAELYTGKEALEDVLRKTGTPRILHLATHGFFLSDLELSDLQDETMVRGISIFLKPNGKRAKIINPLLRSGFALAGANSVLKSGDAEKSDGIVTAEKILGLRLRGTDMVVLSACETGLGEVKTGEGVFGLRRAFTQAGARSLVMSMWSVPDKETKELMIEFYKNILSGKMNRCQALRQAVLKEMKIVTERYSHPNPCFWGAFIFMGEP